MTYEAWRISFQDSEQAARAAYKLAVSKCATKAEQVRAVVKAAQDFDSQLDALSDVIGVVHESPFIAAVFRMQDAAISAVDDEGGSVAWFVYDNQFGIKQLKATPDADKYPMRPIKTVEDLLWLLQLS
jgi:hypothetical protein